MSIKRVAVLFITAWLAASNAFALPLWEITGTRNHVLLLGSIHTLRRSDYPLDPAIAKAVDAGTLKVVPAVYDVGTGRVELLELPDSIAAPAA